MSVSLSASPIYIKSGKSGTIPISITTQGDPKCAVLQFALGYPTGWPAPVLSLGSSASSAGKGVDANTANPQTVFVGGTNLNPIPDGPLVLVQLTVPKKTPKGNYPLVIGAVVAYDPTGTISIPATGGTVQVTVVSPFDLNLDGSVDSSDASLVIRQILGLDPVNPDADFDGNGVVDAGDYQLLVASGIIGGQ